MADWPWWEVKWNLTSRYKFVMAIENSIEMDYVTEKLFHAFIVGTVPSMLRVGFVGGSNVLNPPQFTWEHLTLISSYPHNTR